MNWRTAVKALLVLWPVLKVDADLVITSPEEIELQERIMQQSRIMCRTRRATT